MMREPAQGAQGPTVAGPDRRGLRGRDAEIDAIQRLMNDARTGRRAGVRNGADPASPVPTYPWLGRAT